MIDDVLQDVRYAVRSLRRTPGFTVTVAVMMALGIGINSMIFSCVNTVLFSPLPFPDPDRLVQVDAVNLRHPEDRMGMSFPDFRDVRAQSSSFSAIAAYSNSVAQVNFGGEPERFRSTTTTASLLSVLGIEPALGRWFTPDEDLPGHDLASVVISRKLWSERFHSDPGVLGRPIRMNGRVRTIIGVLPERVRFPEMSDFYTPLAFDPVRDVRGIHRLRVTGRLRPGATLAQARAENASIAARMAAAWPQTNAGVGGRLTLYREMLTAQIRGVVVLLQFAVLFVLLIACANVANLTLARSAGRRREVAVRHALGATRTRIVRQLFTESLLLALLGGLGGVLVAHWSLALTLAATPSDRPYWLAFGIDRTTLFFHLGVSVLAGLAFGLAPAWQASGHDLRASLHEGGVGSGDSPVRTRTRQGLVVAEIALAMVLLISAGLMVRSFLRLQELSSGLDPQGVLVGRVSLPAATYPDEAHWSAFAREFRDELARQPGVRSVSAVAVLPLGDASWTVGITREGHDERTPQSMPILNRNAVLPGYFRTLGIPLRGGRDFDENDRANTPHVAIVNAAAAARLWPGRDAVGQRFTDGPNDTLGWTTVVGVVGDVPQNVRTRDNVAEIFVPMAQSASSGFAVVVKSDRDLGALARTVRTKLRERDSDLPFYGSMSMRQYVQQSQWEARLYATMMAVFAAVALVIAALGIHGVMAYTVAQRTREIGIRMALGAARADVQRLVVGQALRMTLLGMGLGLAGALAMTRLMSSLLFHVSPTDPPTFTIVTMVLAASGLVAAWLPAARATRVDPMVALRAD